MTSVFQTFTAEEVDSIKSVVMVGQQSDDMLLSNSTHRSLNETRAFIRRFKKFLVDTHTTSEEIASMANQQYVAIITAARSRKNGRQTMSSAHSMMNLSLPFTNPADSLPLKFRSKFSHNDEDNDASTKHSIPTRSRSVSTNLNQEAQSPTPSAIQVIPPLNFNFPQGCKSPDEIVPGCLAAVMRSDQVQPIIGRVLALKSINGVPHALVAFIALSEEAIPPAYLPLNHLVLVKREDANAPLMPNDQMTVDTLLKRIMEQGKSIVMTNGDILYLQCDENTKRSIAYHAMAFSSQLQLLAFVANWEVPNDKIMLMLREIFKMSQPKYASTGIINMRCQELIMKILKYV